MTRTADYTIKGFQYQFNKSLLEILQSTDDTLVTLEGIIEDIDLATPSGATAIQCKYHEAQQRFAISLVYKSILQMMTHFHSNPTADIRYILFAHFPDQTANTIYNITCEEVQSILSSNNKELKKYIQPIKDSVNIGSFIGRFRLEFGQSFDILVASVHTALSENGLPAAEVETLSYPNAIQHIAMISTAHDPAKRTITKLQLLDTLRQIRKTAVSRWTLSLKTRDKVLQARRKQLKTNLDKNARLRYFVVSGLIDNFKENIVLFIGDFLDKYHFKPAHIRTPLFCLDCSAEDFKDIRLRLHQKGIMAADGFVGDYFDSAWFFREPMLRKLASKEIEREFKIRLLRFPSHYGTMSEHKCDDLFLIGNDGYDGLDIVDVNVERLGVMDFKEARYIIGVSNVYE